MRPNAQSITDFKAKLRGTLIQPGDSDYDAVRVVWNGMIDRRPSLIARCHGAADVIASVDFARSHGLLVAVRGGGHNVAGYAVCDGGLMIDLSLMRAIRVDPQAQRAWVQGGATWGDVDHETTAFGLATPGGVVSMTGVGGLTLSGGIGWLRQTHGLCVDNVVSVDIVTADGQLLHADHTSHPELFWAVRGGGGNFGIVTSFEFRLHPIAPEVMFCAPLYPDADAPSIIAAWRDLMATAPERLCSLIEFSTIPDADDFPPETHGARVLAVAAVYDGPADEGEAAVQPLRELGNPVLDFSGRMPYCAIQSLYDGLFPKGRDRSYFKSLYLSSLSDAVIADIMGRWKSCPSPMSLTSVWHFGGRYSAWQQMRRHSAIAVCLSCSASIRSGRRPRTTMPTLRGPATSGRRCNAIPPAASISILPAMAKTRISCARRMVPKCMQDLPQSSGHTIRQISSA